MHWEEMRESGIGAVVVGSFIDVEIVAHVEVGDATVDPFVVDVDADDPPMAMEESMEKLAKDHEGCNHRFAPFFWGTDSKACCSL